MIGHSHETLLTSVPAQHGRIVRRTHYTSGTRLEDEPLDLTHVVLVKCEGKNWAELDAESFDNAYKLAVNAFGTWTDSERVEIREVAGDGTIDTQKAHFGLPLALCTFGPADDAALSEGAI